MMIRIQLALPQQSQANIGLVVRASIGGERFS